MKVLFFDVWTKGVRCFKPIDQELKSIGIRTKLIHLGSFKEQCVEFEEIDGVDVYDVSFYKTKFIYKVLEKERPVAVFSLNTTYIWDRALIMACHDLNIACFFLSHGDFYIGQELEAIIKEDHKRNSLFNTVPKIFRYYRSHLQNYFYSYFKSKKKPYSIFTLIQVLSEYFLSPARTRYYVKVNTDILYDKAFIYSDVYTDYYRKVGYDINQIIITGYPEYDIVYQKIENHLFCISDLPVEVKNIVEAGKNYALYLDPAYADSNFLGWDKNSRNNHLTNIANRLKELGFVLVAKIHPSNTKLEDIEVYSENIIIIQHADLATLSFFCRFAIVYSSTSNNLPLLMNKPLVTPKWGLSSKTINRYPAGVIYEWENINDDIPLDNSENRKAIVEKIIPRIGGQNASKIIVDEFLKYVGKQIK